MKHPSRAVVLAAGLGTRMDPLSRVRPKGLMPFWGKPLLDHTLELLAEWGVGEVVINLHHCPSAFLDFARGRNTSVPRINFSFEPEILGTAGALRRAAWFTGDEPFWIVNSDVVAELSPTPFLDVYRRHHPAAVLWLEPSAGPRTVEAHDGLITCFRSRSPQAAGTFTFCGIQLVSPRILRFLPKCGFSTLVDLYEAAMRAAEEIRGVCVAGSFWADVGTTGVYLDAHARALQAYRTNLPGRRLVIPEQIERVKRLQQGGIRVTGFVSVGDQSVVRRGARLENSVLWDRVRVGGAADVRRAILADGVHVPGRVRGAAVQADSAADTAISSTLRHLGWRAERTLLMPLDPRGSDRSFTRLRCGRRKAVVMSYGTEREENALYARHSRFLAGMGVPVPRLLLDRPSERLCVIEDLGCESLADAAGRGFGARVAGIYTELIGIVARLHLKGRAAALARGIPLNPPFDSRLYRWEHELFERRLLPHFPALPARLVSEAMLELSAVSRRLLREPRVLLHRDLQSGNILIAKGRPVLIDFQGMRMGPAVYDLASLLCDPYVSPPVSLRERLLTAYATATGKTAADLQSAFRYGAVQRLVQALGAYGRLGALPATRRFLKHVAPALNLLNESLAELDKFPRLRELVGKLTEVRL